MPARRYSFKIYGQRKGHKSVFLPIEDCSDHKGPCPAKPLMGLKGSGPDMHAACRKPCKIATCFA